MTQVSEDIKNPVETSSDDGEEDVVPVSKYKEVQSESIKRKQELRELKAKLAEQEAALKEKEEQDLANQKKFEDLWRKEKEEKDNLIRNWENEKSARKNESKLNAVISQLEGGFKKAEYNKFINVDAVTEREDGSFDPKSVSAEVKRLRQEFPELLKASQVASTPSTAPSKTTVKTGPSNQLEHREALGETLRQMKQNRKK